MQPNRLVTNNILAAIFVLAVISFAAACNTAESPSSQKPDPVAANILSYTHTWDEIVNKRRLEMFNDSNFTKDVIMHVTPTDIVGIDSARAYYANYLTGFSDITFTIKDVFGQGDKLVKYWNFSGKHTGVFFGIPATGKTISLDGVTLVRLAGRKIAEERDFIDNMDLMTQLGQLPPAK